MIPTSRYNHQLLLYIIAGGIFSFLLSLFLLQLFFGLLVILWLTEKNSEKKKAFDTVGLLIIIFFAARLISIIFSPYPEISYQALYKDALFYLGFFAFAFYFRVLSEEEIKRVFIFLLISFAVFSITGLMRFNLGAVRRTEAFSSGYTTFSSFLVAGTGLTMAFSKSIFNKRILLFSLLMSLMYTALITSLGRFNIIIAVLLFVLGIILFRINYRALILILVFTSAFTYVSFLNNSTEAEQRIQQPVQLSDRDIIFEGAQELWKERPLIGFGPRTFREIFPFTINLQIKEWEAGIMILYNYILRAGSSDY
jgi:O-antigen ligase